MCEEGNNDLLGVCNQVYVNLVSSSAVECTNAMAREVSQVRAGHALLGVKREAQKCGGGASSPGIRISRITNKPVRSYVRKKLLPVDTTSPAPSESMLGSGFLDHVENLVDGIALDVIMNRRLHERSGPEIFDVSIIQPLPRNATEDENSAHSHSYGRSSSSPSDAIYVSGIRTPNIVKSKLQTVVCPMFPVRDGHAVIAEARTLQMSAGPKIIQHQSDEDNVSRLSPAMTPKLATCGTSNSTPKNPLRCYGRMSLRSSTASSQVQSKGRLRRCLNLIKQAGSGESLDSSREEHIRALQTVMTGSMESSNIQSTGRCGNYHNEEKGRIGNQTWPSTSAIALENVVPGWIHDDADILEDSLTDTNVLNDIDHEGRGFLRKVVVRALDLDWGGEYLSNPCQYVFGVVQRLVLDGRNGEPCFDIDFGLYLGTQVVPVLDCRAWEPPSVTKAEQSAVDSVIRYAKAVPFGNWDVLGTHSLRQDQFQPQSDVKVDERAVQRSSSSNSILLEPSAAGMFGRCGINATINLESVDQIGMLDAFADDDPEWIPTLSLAESATDGCEEYMELSNTRGDDDLGNSAGVLLGQLGVYCLGNLSQEESNFNYRYADNNWHAKSWNLLPRKPFNGPTPGSKVKYPKDIPGPTQLFLELWSEKIQQRIVRESNNYAMLKHPKYPGKVGSPGKHPRITRGEYRKFIGICIFMAIREQPSIRDYWSVGAHSLHCEVVVKTMTRNRFLHILESLHIVPRSAIVYDKKDPKYDPIVQVRWLLENLVSNFRQVMNASPYLCVDECMVGYNGKFCSFKQFMPAKPITHGIKLWCMACSVTKYIFSLEVYVGARNEAITNFPVHACGSGAGVVSRLTKGWENMNYTVVMDNFFTSPMLFEDLLGRGFYAVGTVRRGRLGFPSSLCIPDTGERGDLHVRMHKERHMCAIHWQDTKGVTFLSTATNPVQTKGMNVERTVGGKKMNLPTSPIQILYSKFMRGVDTQDQLRTWFSTNLNTKKWWHRLYFCFKDAALTNAYVRHRELCIAMERVPLSHSNFMVIIAHDLMGFPLEKGFGERINSAGSGKCSSTAVENMPDTGEAAALVGPIVIAGQRRRRRPNHLRNAPHHGILPRNNRAFHYSFRATRRRKCRALGCQNRTKWVCMECSWKAICPGACFLSFHT